MLSMHSDPLTLDNDGSLFAKALQTGVDHAVLALYKALTGFAVSINHIVSGWT